MKLSLKPKIKVKINKWSLAKETLVFVTVGVAFFVLYFWKLATLVPGLSAAEAQSEKASLTWHAILNNPANAVYNSLQHVLLYDLKVTDHRIFLARAASAIFATIFVMGFYILCKDWFGKLIGSLGTILLATLPMTIILARNATPAIMYFSLIIIMVAYRHFIKDQKHSHLSLAVLVVLIALSLYTPGMIWLVIVATVAVRKRLLEDLKALPKLKLAGLSALKLVVLAPLIYGIVKNIKNLWLVLLIPTHWQNLATSLKSIGWMLLSLVWRTQSHNNLILGRLPILNLTIVVLAIFGLYALWTRVPKLVYSALAVIVLVVVAAGINTNFSILALAVPVLAIAGTLGLRYLYVEWRGIFPTNPLPKTLALFFIGLVVGINMVYGVSYGLRAWPDSLVTRQAYMLK